MKEFNVHWKPLSQAGRDDGKSAQFFALELDRQILYLGMSHSLSLLDEVEEAEKLFNLNNRSVSIWVGEVQKMVHNRSDRQVAEEILCLLVYNQRPVYNIVCKESYYGRDGLVIRNHGCNFLPPALKAEKKNVRMTG